MKKFFNWFIDIWWTIPMGIGAFELISLANWLMNAASTASFWTGILLWIACAAISITCGYFFAKKTYLHLLK